MKFSVIVVTFNRKNELEACLASLMAQKISVPYETIVIYNGETSYLEKMKNAYPHTGISIPASTPAFARNVGLTKASGEYIFFLDDDCVLPADYFSKIDFSENWDILGGPDRTPPGSTKQEKLIGLVLSSPFCMGPTFRRHSSTLNYVDKIADETELILCNLWIRREIFSRERHRFEETLFRNEENFLLKELKLQGKKIFYNPDLFVYHLRKGSLEKLSKSIMKSGECRTQNYFKLPLRSELIYFLPLIFMLALFYSIFNPYSILTAFFGLYFLATFSYGAIRLRTIHPGFSALHIFILFFYSWGLSKELLQEVLKFKRKVLNS
ncbi:MAG: glycosyltransferase [Bdellovibrionales bacterium]|nr:glycosyltransferase [Bdellovibrionales bacterium]